MTSQIRTEIQTVGFIGAGRIGSAVARLAVDAGYDVVLSNSRGPETLADLVADLGPRARAASREEAAEAADALVVTIPLHAVGDVPVAPLDGTIVLDTNNYYPDRDGHVAALDEHRATTSGLLQEHLPGAHVVKVFGTINSEAIVPLARPSGDPERCALPVFGDDADAKARAVALLDRLGYDVHDGGGLDESWRAENGQPAYGMPYATDGDMARPRPASADEIAALLARADREDVELMTFAAPE
ncbi:NAD(P)-binding domain-containing protein [Nocardioides lentus]|uniref:NAD(P)-binding domain-containing protein n=1 Tax=Nocardioides lentus TaxID=338077 RepID=A0ABN2P1R3_9ACTN